LGALQKQSALYFKNADISKSEWVRNSVTGNNFSGLTICEKQQLIDISCNGSLKGTFDADKLSQFGMLLKNSYPIYQSNKGFTSFCDNILV
jgi:hypothetical protein